MLPEIALAHTLMQPYLPEGTSLQIETSASNCSYPVVMHLTYTSKRSGRTMAVMAKGDALPTLDDYILRFYIKQLVLEPSEVLKEFSRLYFLERKARQESFLRDGKTGMGDRGSLVSSRAAKLDRLKASQYSASAAQDEAVNA